MIRVSGSLFGKLFVASVLVLGVFFGFIYYIVNQISIDNIHQTKTEQLRLQNYLLLSSAQLEEDGIELPDELREPRFEEYESGLYGFISTPTRIFSYTYSAHSLEISPELLLHELTGPGEAVFRVTEGYFIYHHTVLWEVGDDNAQLITFTVLEDRTPSLLALKDFQSKMRQWLTGVGILLIATLLGIMRWGTKPLRTLAENLKQIEKGEQDHITGQYPLELISVSKNLNLLIDTERKQRERYHTTLADLAHSLKTPLAVIQAQLETEQAHQGDITASYPLITEQVQRMDEIISHQLQRAVISGGHQLSETIALQQPIDRLIQAMSKVYADKGIDFQCEIADNSAFRGDQRDLMEVLGNVLDNACKACQKHIKIRVSTTAYRLLIELHDDGAGIPVTLREQIIKRGARADSRHSGQGIGLDIVQDIIDSYGGKLLIEDSPLGGAMIHIEFPLTPA